MCIMDVAIHSLTCTTGLCGEEISFDLCFAFLPPRVAMHRAHVRSHAMGMLVSRARMAATARSELYSFWSKDLSGGAGLGDAS